MDRSWSTYCFLEAQGWRLARNFPGSISTWRIQASIKVLTFFWQPKNAKLPGIFRSRCRFWDLIPDLECLLISGDPRMEGCQEFWRLDLSTNTWVSSNWYTRCFLAIQNRKVARNLAGLIINFETRIQIRTPEWCMAILEFRVARNFKRLILTLRPDPRFEELTDFWRIKKFKLAGVQQTGYWIVNFVPDLGCWMISGNSRIWNWQEFWRLGRPRSTIRELEISWSNSHASEIRYQCFDISCLDGLLMDPLFSRYQNKKFATFTSVPPSPFSHHSSSTKNIFDSHQEHAIQAMDSKLFILHSTHIPS